MSDLDITEFCSLGSNLSVLVKVTTLQQTGSKPLPEAIMTKFSEVCICHQATMS